MLGATTQISLFCSRLPIHSCWSALEQRRSGKGEMNCHMRSEELASILEHGGAFRVLRPVEVMEGVVESGDEFTISAVAAVLDTETTGLEYARHHRARHSPRSI